MSNIIRLNQPRQVEKKVIGIKKINKLRANVNQSPNRQEIDPEEQKRLLQIEIEGLEIQHRQLQDQIKEDNKNARNDIENWWKEKQEEAKLEAQRLAETASAQGFQEGFDQAVLKAEAEFQQQRQEMQELIQIAYEEKTKIVQQSESFLLELSVKIAEKVINEELKQHTDQLLNMVKQSLKQVEEYKDVVIQVAPEDYPVILPFLAELESYIGTDAEVKLIPVPHFTKGSCMIHTESGSYDLTVSSQLQEIRQHLLAYCEEKINDEPKGR